MKLVKKFQIISVSYVLLALIDVLILANPAGVLPYSKFQGKHVVLLGVDHHRPGYWMDFGGKSDWGETTIETAAREFSEETMFCFYPQMTDVKKKLKLETPIVASNGYHMYFLDVPFMCDLNKVQQDLVACHTIEGQPYSGSQWLMDNHIEKIDYAWVYADELKKAFAKAKDKKKNITLKSIDGRTVELHSLLADSLSLPQAQKMLNAL